MSSVKRYLKFVTRSVYHSKPDAFYDGHGYRCAVWSLDLLDAKYTTGHALGQKALGGSAQTPPDGTPMYYAVPEGDEGKPLLVAPNSFELYQKGYSMTFYKGVPPEDGYVFLGHVAYQNGVTPAGDCNVYCIKQSEVALIPNDHEWECITQVKDGFIDVKLWLLPYSGGFVVTDSNQSPGQVYDIKPPTSN